MTAQKGSKMSVSQQLHAMGRVLGYMLKDYKFSFFVVVVCILGSALATLRGTLFMQSLIDDYIVPLTQAQTPDYSNLAAALVSVAVTYGIGIICAYAYNRIMVNISQGTMRNLRIELFQHMESLPIRYFDTHENLLETNGIYREIYEAQTQGGGDFDQPAPDGKDGVSA